MYDNTGFHAEAACPECGYETVVYAENYGKVVFLLCPHCVEDNEAKRTANELFDQYEQTHLEPVEGNVDNRPEWHYA